MATQTLEFNSGSGLTINCKLFAVGSDVLVDSAVAVEKTNDLNQFSADFADLPAGAYRLNGFVGANGGFANEVFDVEASTATYYPRSELGNVPSAEENASAVRTELAAELASIGGGIHSIVVDVQDGDGNPVRGADVGLAGSDYSETSNTEGELALNVNNGTYTLVTIPPSNYGTPAVQVVVVDGDSETATITLTAQSLPGADHPSMCNVAVDVIDEVGTGGAVTPVIGVTVTATLDEKPEFAAGALLFRQRREATTDENGRATLTLIRAVNFVDETGVYTIRVNDKNRRIIREFKYSVPDQAAAVATQQ